MLFVFYHFGCKVRHKYSKIAVRTSNKVNSVTLIRCVKFLISGDDEELFASIDGGLDVATA